MQSDNNQEMFPIVDEQGTITGTATRGECHSGSKLLHPVVHLHVFHLLKGGAVALDDLHQAARAVLLLPENQHLQRVGRVSLRKDDIFLHAVAVQICHLHRLLVFSGDRCGVAQAVHGGIDGGLQAVILLRALGQRIHFIHRLQGAAGQQNRREDDQKKQPYSLFHGINSS